MRSRLEADYAAYLDREQADWEYEPECYASPDGQWLPDFRVMFKGDSGPLLVELKPAGRLEEDYMSSAIDEHLAKMTIAWASATDLSLSLIYWKYGAGAAVMVITSHGQGSPWLAKGGPLPLLWSGMGQFTRCCEPVGGW